MVNYQNGKIYMIESLIGNCRYYGSTTQTLAQRLGIHKKDNKKKKKKKNKKKKKAQHHKKFYNIQIFVFY